MNIEIITDFIAKNTFLIALCVFAAVNLIIAHLFLIRASYYGNLTQLTGLARAKWKGCLAFAISFLWLIPHIEDLFDPHSVIIENYLVYIGAIVAFILVCCFADFLFARGICILLIFCSYILLREGYAAQPPYYNILAWLLFVPGITGIIIAAHPVMMRDWLSASVEKKWVRIISGLPYLLIGLAALGEVLLIVLPKQA